MFDLPDEQILPLSLEHNFWTWCQSKVNPIAVKKARGVLLGCKWKAIPQFKFHGDVCE